jgi:hypothetical protein
VQVAEERPAQRISLGAGCLAIRAAQQRTCATAPAADERDGGDDTGKPKNVGKRRHHGSTPGKEPSFRALE